MIRIHTLAACFLLALTSSCTAVDPPAATVRVILDVTNSDRYTFVSLPLDYLRLYHPGDDYSSATTSELKSASDLNSAFTHLFRPTPAVPPPPAFALTGEVTGVGLRFGDITVQDRNTGELITFATCAPEQTRLREVVTLRKDGTYQLYVPVELDNLHFVARLTALDFADSPVTLR